MLMWRTLCLIQFFILLAIFAYLGLTPHPEDSIPMFNDKLMHCSGYFVAGISISFGLPLWKFSWRAAFLILFSIGIEIGQHFMPPRTFDVLDICANSTGVLIGLTFIALLTKNFAWFKKLLFLQTSAAK